jgi:hypothetical protein
LFNQFEAKVEQWAQDGKITATDRGIIRDGLGRRYCGDYDLYDITRNRVRLNAGDVTFNRVMDKLKLDPITVQHPPHMNWNAGDWEWLKQEIITRHQTTEPLYEFREDGSIWRVFAE